MNLYEIRITEESNPHSVWDEVEFLANNFGEAYTEAEKYRVKESKRLKKQFIISSVVLTYVKIVKKDKVKC